MAIGSCPIWRSNTAFNICFNMFFFTAYVEVLKIRPIMDNCYLNYYKLSFE